MRLLLITGSNVDDAQAAVAEPDVPIEEQPCVVGAAMGNDVSHSFQGGA
jgi:hypothetical protein